MNRTKDEITQINLADNDSEAEELMGKIVDMFGGLTVATTTRALVAALRFSYDERFSESMSIEDFLESVTGLFRTVRVTGFDTERPN